jgi:hypothetical protein
MGGIWWIIERRMQLQRLNNNNSVEDESAENEDEK